MLVFLGTGPLLMLAGIRRLQLSDAPSACGLERECWRGLWMPLVPAALVLFALAGWALLEPDNAERLPNILLVAAIPFAWVWLRAAARALVSLIEPVRVSTAATVGVLKPRIVVSREFERTLDACALSAAVGHEERHRRHRDPLRVWLARVATDLQWPGPSARRRLDRWRYALELARDEEARITGIEGADLAAAIIAAVRLDSATTSSCVSITGDPTMLQERIVRLLAPLTGATGDDSRHARIRPWAMVVPPLAVLSGAIFGEAIVRALVQHLS